MNPPPCATCTEPATRQVTVGTVLRGDVWRRAYAWACESCTVEAVRGREEARSK